MKKSKILWNFVARIKYNQRKSIILLWFFSGFINQLVAIANSSKMLFPIFQKCILFKQAQISNNIKKEKNYIIVLRTKGCSLIGYEIISLTWALKNNWELGVKYLLKCDSEKSYLSEKKQLCPCNATAKGEITASVFVPSWRMSQYKEKRVSNGHFNRKKSSV